MDFENLSAGLTGMNAHAALRGLDENEDLRRLPLANIALEHCHPLCPMLDFGVSSLAKQIHTSKNIRDQ